MSDSVEMEIPKSFYWIGGIAVVWNLIGIMTYVMQVSMTPETIAAMPANTRHLYTDIPVWATSAYAIATNAGLLGSVLLLLRKRMALAFFIVSLAGVIVQFFHAFVLMDTVAVMGPGSLILPCLITLIGIFLIWYSVHSRKNGWLS